MNIPFKALIKWQFYNELYLILKNTNQIVLKAITAQKKSTLLSFTKFLIGFSSKRSQYVPEVPFKFPEIEKFCSNEEIRRDIETK